MPLDSINVRVFDEPKDAPIYRLPEYKAVTLDSVAVVGKGTVNGNPTVDLIFSDGQGQKYMALVKGSFLETIGELVKSKCKS